MEKISEEQVFGLMLDKIAEEAAYEEYNAILDELEKEAKVSFKGSWATVKNTAAKIGDAYSARKLRDTVKSTTGVYTSGAKGKAQRLNIPKTIISTAKSPAGRKSLTAPGIAYGGTLVAGAGAYKGLGTLGKKAELQKEAKPDVRGSLQKVRAFLGKGFKGEGVGSFGTEFHKGRNAVKGLANAATSKEGWGALGRSAVAYGGSAGVAGGAAYGGYRGVQGLRGE